ncbi:hypothetical protein OEV98_07135 [Caldibacillus lycopersici]|uniref:Uncharacterized protein n=1 Tax=Perspicuibacillus lycopersici TaxID=1325689 RepID=A0AAE3IRZ6_9BACI|nr:hypothetical protein [Perspicuibacillus lycopersici]MCU9613327.1 hypothetical protein [Perspicuibacillus lycopersici]
MKILIFIIIILIVLAIVSFFYNLQLGAIPFLLLSIFFMYRAWKAWKRTD